MKRYRWALLSVATAAVALTASAAQAQIVKGAHGKRFGAAIASWSSRSMNSSAGSGAVDYNGGQVLHSSSPYLFYWDPKTEIPSSSRALLSQYLGDVSAASGASTDVYSVLRQYTDTTGFADYRQFFGPGQVINDTSAYPANGCPVVSGLPICITDAQVQTEVTRVVNADRLPTGTGAGAPIYSVITPPEVNICFDAAGTQCGNNFFCAYHSFLTEDGQNVLYAVVPFNVWELSPTKGCQTDGTRVYQTPGGEGDHAYQIADNMSHELSETITDPLLDAWFSNLSGEEVGDNCATYGQSNPLNGTSRQAYAPVLGGSEKAGTLFDQVINGDGYYNQTEWSNGNYGCEAQTSAGQVNPAFASSATTANRNAAITFTPSGTTSSTGFSSATWNFGDGSPTVFTRSAPSQVSHAFSRGGTYVVTLTVVDTVGNLATASHTVTIR